MSAPHDRPARRGGSGRRQRLKISLNNRVYMRNTILLGALRHGFFACPNCDCPGGSGELLPALDAPPPCRRCGASRALWVRV